MRILLRARATRRIGAGLLLGGVAGWAYGLLQKPERAGLPEAPPLTPAPAAEPEPELTHEVAAAPAQDVPAPVRKSTSRARTKASGTASPSVASED